MNVPSITLSARNKLTGKIEELQSGGVMAHVVIRVGNDLIESVITRRSAEEMKLKIGDTGGGHSAATMRDFLHFTSRLVKLLLVYVPTHPILTVRGSGLHEIKRHHFPDEPTKRVE